MTDMMKAYILLTTIAPKTNTLDSITFGSFYCMLLEEWCREHNKDITAIIEQIAQSIADVNTVYGRYGDPDPCEETDLL